jgi:hypothetical protein
VTSQKPIPAPPSTGTNKSGLHGKPRLFSGSISVMSFADYKQMRETRLEDLATVHPSLTHVAELFEKFKSFD